MQEALSLSLSLIKALGSYDVDQLCLSTTDGGASIQPDDPIPAQNTAHRYILKDRECYL